MAIGDIILGLASIAIGYSQIKKGVANINPKDKGHNRSNLGVVTQRRGENPSRRINSETYYALSGGPPLPGPSSEGNMKIRGVNNLDDRMAAIIEMSRRGKVEPSVMAWARSQVTRKCRAGKNGEQWCTPEKDTLAEINAIYQGMREDVRYTSDIRGFDTYVNPKHTLNMKAGDCLPGNTLLVTPGGLVPISDIKEGDSIHDGENWVKVTRWWDKGVQSVDSYLLNNGSTLTCTKGHRVFKSTAEGAVEALAGDLLEGDVLLQPESTLPELAGFRKSGGTIKEISREVSTVSVFDIETESGRIYLPESDIIVHNCDDYASLGVAALNSIGIPARYKVIRTKSSNDWDHIYIQAGTPKEDPKKWISLDASVPMQAGWEAPASMVADSRIYETE